MRLFLPALFLAAAPLLLLCDQTINILLTSPALICSHGRPLIYSAIVRFPELAKRGVVTGQAAEISSFSGEPARGIMTVPAEISILDEFEMEVRARGEPTHLRTDEVEESMEMATEHPSSTASPEEMRKRLETAAATEETSFSSRPGGARMTDSAVADQRTSKGLSQRTPEESSREVIPTSGTENLSFKEMKENAMQLVETRERISDEPMLRAGEPSSKKENVMHFAKTGRRIPEEPNSTSTSASTPKATHEMMAVHSRQSTGEQGISSEGSSRTPQQKPEPESLTEGPTPASETKSKPEKTRSEDSTETHKTAPDESSPASKAKSKSEEIQGTKGTRKPGSVMDGLTEESTLQLTPEETRGDDSTGESEKLLENASNLKPKEADETRSSLAEETQTSPLLEEKTTSPSSKRRKTVTKTKEGDVEEIIEVVITNTKVTSKDGHATTTLKPSTVLITIFPTASTAKEGERPEPSARKKEPEPPTETTDKAKDSKNDDSDEEPEPDEIILSTETLIKDISDPQKTTTSVLELIVVQHTSTSTAPGETPSKGSGLHTSGGISQEGDRSDLWIFTSALGLVFLCVQDFAMVLQIAVARGFW